MGPAVHLAKLEKLFSLGDSTGDGALSKEDFDNVCRIPEIKAWLGAQGVDARDSEKLVKMLDERHRGVLEAADLVKGVGRLKGFAKALDFSYAQYQSTQRDHQLLKQIMSIQHKLESVELLCAKAHGTEPCSSKVCF